MSENKKFWKTPPLFFVSMATVAIFVQPIPIFLHNSIKLNANNKYTKFHKDLPSSYWEKCNWSFSNLIRFHGNGGHFEFFFIGKHFYSWWVTILWSFIEFGWAVSKKLRGQFHWRRRIRIIIIIIIIRNGGKTISLHKLRLGDLIKVPVSHEWYKSLPNELPWAQISIEFLIILENLSEKCF